MALYHSRSQQYAKLSRCMSRCLLLLLLLFHPCGCVRLHVRVHMYARAHDCRQVVLIALRCRQMPRSFLKLMLMRKQANFVRSDGGKRKFCCDKLKYLWLLRSQGKH
ncbi:uncharacterized protein LOC129236142 [Anastrepha obliqua]|uniref:uncharacterized protein LOC129236142 n=1 Tax=Anastrepha obliqua TaxID=95512 RepID=UPI00240A88E0|nr:uncharacterized protein LOC129236142 [Anastrepha obliqua]